MLSPGLAARAGLSARGTLGGRGTSSSRARAAGTATVERLTAANADAWLDQVDTLIFDCDGVLWRGPENIPGAADALARLRSMGKRVLFVTNNASKSRAMYADKFASLGIQADASEIVAASFAAAAYLTEAFGAEGRAGGRNKVYLVGDVGVERELEEAGIEYIGGQVAGEAVGMDPAEQLAEVLDPDVGAVVVGHDPTFSYRRLCLASMYVRELGDGGEFVGTNPDHADRIGGGRWMPGTGGLLAAVELAAGRRATVVGKGGEWLLPFLSRSLGLDPARTAMVGDRLDTDIALGAQGGLRTLLVLTGVSGEADVAACGAGCRPERVAESVAVLLGERARLGE